MDAQAKFRALCVRFWYCLNNGYILLVLLLVLLLEKVYDNMMRKTYSTWLGREKFEQFGEFDKFIYEEASQLTINSDGSMILSVSFAISFTWWPSLFNLFTVIVSKAFCCSIYWCVIKKIKKINISGPLLPSTALQLRLLFLPERWAPMRACSANDARSWVSHIKNNCRTFYNYIKQSSRSRLTFKQDESIAAVWSAAPNKRVRTMSWQWMTLLLSRVH